MPLVRGCEGCASRAHVNTCGSSATTSGLAAGSFHTSQATMRLSFANAPITPCTYSFSRGYCEESLSAGTPGLCTHPELCTPGIGGCCGPSFGSASQQESKSTKIGWMWCLSAIVKNVLI